MLEFVTLICLFLFILVPMNYKVSLNIYVTDTVHDHDYLLDRKSEKQNRTVQCVDTCFYVNHSCKHWRRIFIDMIILTLQVHHGSFYSSLIHLEYFSISLGPRE